MVKASGALPSRAAPLLARNAVPPVQQLSAPRRWDNERWDAHSGRARLGTAAAVFSAMNCCSRLAVSLLLPVALASFTQRAAASEPAFETSNGARVTEVAPQGSSSQNDSNDTWRPKLSASAGIGFGVDYGFTYRGVAGVEPLPWFFLGASYRRIGSSPHFDGYRTNRATHIASAVFELHPVSVPWFDPYLAVDVGWGWDSFEYNWDGPTRHEEAGVSAALGGGCMFGSRRFSGGSQLVYVKMPEAYTGGESALIFEGRVDVRF
jgi:hypothetical protein